MPNFPAILQHAQKLVSTQILASGALERFQTYSDSMPVEQVWLGYPHLPHYHHQCLDARVFLNALISCFCWIGGPSCPLSLPPPPLVVLPPLLLLHPSSIPPRHGRLACLKIEMLTYSHSITANTNRNSVQTTVKDIVNTFELGE